MKTDVFLTIATLASEKFSINKQNIEADFDIFETLKINSIEVLSLLTDLETHFEIEIPDYELQDVKTFAQLSQVIQDRL